MAKQQGREFASTDPTTRIQDARVQERGISPKISLNPRHDLQHIQRPTAPYLSQNAPSLPGLGNADMARSRRRGVNSAMRNFPHQISNNVTKPAGKLLTPATMHPSQVHLPAERTTGRTLAAMRSASAFTGG